MGIFDVINRACLTAFRERASDRGVVRVNGVEVPAIFDSAFYAADDGEMAAVDRVTTIAIRDEDSGPIAVGANVLARGAAYVVRERRPDSEGMTVYELEEA